MLQQEAMIERVRDVCQSDERLAAAMMYGSFAQGEGDELSDIEFILFFEDEALRNLDQEEWVSRISPVELYFVNEYGNGTAIFDDLIRGEFHFDRASEISRIDESWKDSDWLPTLGDTLVLDRTGELTRRLGLVVGPPPDRDTPERARSVCARFVNWLLFGSNLMVRGELARAMNLLGIVRDQLLYMVRILEGSTERWFNPGKLLEENISEEAYARYAACTARLQREDLTLAYLAAWAWGREMITALSERHGGEELVPATLLEKLDGRVDAALRDARPGAP
ncbi:MAG: nucleotidyltransferase domain-containing protein [Actinomycetota bacterium]|nr:nucleotidyltransferase domain-containing protein [Actinomycetota bacterium]